MVTAAAMATVVSTAVTMPAIAPGDNISRLEAVGAKTGSEIDVSMQEIAEKLFPFDGVAEVHLQLGPICIQKLS